MSNQPSIIDQAIKNVGDFLSGNNTPVGQFSQSINPAKQINNALGSAGQAIGDFVKPVTEPITKPITDYFDPNVSGQNGFWSHQNPVAENMLQIQPHAENFAQGATLGYYQAPQEHQQNVSEFTRSLEQGAGMTVPFLAATLATGGLADLALPAGALGGGVLEGVAGSMLNAGAAGGLVGLAQHQESSGDLPTDVINRLYSGAEMGAQSAPFGMLEAFNGISNPLIRNGLQMAGGSAGAYGLTKLSGGSDDQAMANAVLGIGTPIFLKAIEHVGGGTGGETLMGKLFDKFGTDSYRFLANKELIQRVITGRGTPEDIAQFNILNNLGLKNAASRSTAGFSVEDPGVKVAKTGAVWDFLQEMFPGSFKNGLPTEELTNPETSPLNGVPEMQLDPQENEALMKFDEKNPSPADEAIQKTQEEVAQAPATTGPKQQVDEFTGEPLAPVSTPISIDQAPAPELKMQHPDIAQYGDTLKNAVKSYNRNKTQDISTLIKKVPGLDIAVDTLKEQGIPVKSMEDIKLLVKGLPKGQIKVAPQTAAERLAIKNGAKAIESPFNSEKTVTEADVQKYGKDLQSPQGVQLVETLVKGATVEKPVLDVTFGDIATKNGGQFDSRVKDPRTIIEKVITKRKDGRKYQPTDVNDVYGGRITVPDNATKINVLTQLKALSKGGLFNVVNSQKVAKTGYTSTHVDLKSAAGTPVEIQIVTPHEDAVALANHAIRAIYGEKAPENIEKIKIRNEKIINKLTPEEATKLANDIRSMPQQNIPLDLGKAQKNTVITDPSHPNYDFEKDMDFQAARGSTEFTGGSTSEMAKQQSLEGSIGATETAQGQNAPEGAPALTRQPEAYDPGLQKVVDRLTGAGDSNLPASRDFTKIMAGRKVTNYEVARQVKSWVDKVLPDKALQEQAFLAADESLPVDNLTPEQQYVVQQINGLNELIGLKKTEMYPGFRMVENYMQRIPIKGDESIIANPFPGKPLSQGTRADFHRNIWKFEPLDGKGKATIQSIDSPNFKLTRSPEDRNIWIDQKGKEYQMAHATVREIEAALPVQYEKNISNVAAQTVNDFLNQKDHFNAVQTIQEGAWKGKAYSPGEQAPGGAREVQIKGLEGWKFAPDVATAIENLTRDPNVSQWETKYAKVEDMVTNLIFYNALKHPFNMANLAFAHSGQYRSGNPVIDAVLPGPQGMVKLASLLGSSNDIVHNPGDVFFAMKDAGSNIGTFGKNTTERFVQMYQKDPNLVKTAAGAVGKYNPGSLLYAGNKKLVAHVDDVLRTGMTQLHYETIHGSPLTADGRTLAADFNPEHLKQAVSLADKQMVDYGNLSRGEKRLQRLAFMFYPWMKGLIGDTATIVKNPVQYRGTIQNLVIMGLAGMAANQAWQQFTGNPDASVDQYGLNKFINDVIKVPGEIKENVTNPKNPRMPTIISSHVFRPIMREAIQQATNRDLLTGKPIYDPDKIVPEGQTPDSQEALRAQHAAAGLIAPAQPFLKVGLGKSTAAEQGLNYLGFKTPHTKGHAAAPNAIGTSVGEALNVPDALPTNGIATLDFRDSVNENIDANTEQQMGTVNQLLSKAYNEGNPVYKLQAYGLLVTNPELQRAKSIMEVGTAQAEKRPVNPLWALGVVDPDKQKVVLQYKSLLPANQKQFKSNPEFKAILDAYNAAQSDYYSQLPAQDQERSGIQAPIPSKEVSALLDEAKATKNYNLYDDPRVQAYFAQLDFYDSFINSQFGLSGSGYNSGGGGYSKNKNYLFYGAEDAAKTKAKVDVSLEGPKLANNFRQSSGGKSGGRLNMQLPMIQPPQNMGGAGPKVLPFSIQQPQFMPVKLNSTGIKTRL